MQLEEGAEALLVVGVAMIKLKRRKKKRRKKARMNLMMTWDSDSLTNRVSFVLIIISFFFL